MECAPLGPIVPTEVFYRFQTPKKLSAYLVLMTHKLSIIESGLVPQTDFQVVVLRTTSHHVVDK